MLENDQIADYLLGDLQAYQENIKEMLVGTLMSSSHKRIYWDAWFRGATGKALENADRGIVYESYKHAH